MKYILFCDLHLHPHEVSAITINDDNSRLIDSFGILQQIEDYAIQNNIKNIICIGDFFHTRKKIDVDVYDRAYSALKEMYNKGLELTLIAGNHDIYYRNTAKVTSLRPLSKFAKIINQPSVIPLPNINILLFPYYEKVEKLIEQIHKYSYPNPVYLLHAEYRGATKAMYSKDLAKKGLDASVFPVDTKKVFMGHYHMKQVLNESTMYLGSPLQISKREIYEDKYFYVFDTDTLELTSIQTNAPKFAVVEYPSEKVLKYYKADATIEEAFLGNYVDIIAFETIKRSSKFNKLLSTARNYIVSSKVKSKNITKQTTEITTLDEDELCNQYIKDNPHSYLTPEFLLIVKNKIVEMTEE